MNQKTEGIVLSHKNFQEADRLLTIYTKDFGKVTAIGKGIRRPRSKKSGHVEIASWCHIYLAHGRNLDILTEAQLIRSFGHEDFSPNKTAKIYHILELVDHLTPQGQRNPQVFGLLLHFLKRTTQNEDFNLVSTAFKLKLLSALGFFSTANLTDSNAKFLLEKFENEEFESLRDSLNITNESYLKLLSFLDSIIEDLSERKLRTTKFINAAI